jgi:TctA family transporter
VFFTRPISAGFMIASILILVAMVLPSIRKKKEQAIIEGGGEAA